MKDVNLTLRSSHVVTPAGVRDALVVVRDGRIAAVEPAGAGVTSERGPDSMHQDLGDAWLLPGLVDTHVHINEPGRTEWEGFETATRAAAAGGVTTLVDMPLNCIPATTTFDAYQAKTVASRGKLHVDVGFWGGVVPGNARELEGLAAAGVLGFKCFMVPSGVGEFEHVSESDLREAMPIVARLGLPLLAHAELPDPIAAASAATTGRDPRAYATWLDSRPAAAEVDAIRLLIRLCEATGCHVHVVHLGTAEALGDLRAARGRGLPITVETCPHYLFFAAEDIEDGATHLKCAPPIRDRANRDALCAALAAGDIDLVATDHSPCPPDLKCSDSGDCVKAWGGIASLELGLGAVWSRMRALGCRAERIAQWMSAAPARLAKLDRRKGRIAPGHDADMVAWDPDAEWRVDAARLHQRHAVTPYAGATLRGRVLATFLGGRKVYDGAFIEAPAGRLLQRR